MTEPGLRGRLRSLSVFATAPPLFDVTQAPPSPTLLFTAWLQDALAAGVAEPHAMTLSTVDEHGLPDARVLILKDVDETGWSFASSALSPKGRQLAQNPAAALTFYWPRVARQVRVRGPVAVASEEECAEDFLARSPGARAETLLGRQSEPRPQGEEVPSAKSGEHEIAPAWLVYVVRASVVEFFQGSDSRDHTRLRYRRDDLTTDGAWTREVLWP